MGAPLPFMKFYPKDWMLDTPVLSLEAQGAWMRLLCGMWFAPDRGRISWPMSQIANFLGVETTRAAALIDELINAGVADGEVSRHADVAESHADVTPLVTLRSRRMLREEDKRREDRERQEQKRKRARDRQSRHRHGDVTEMSQGEVRSQKSEVRGGEKSPSPPAIRCAQVLSDMIFKNFPNRTAPTEAILMNWAREADRIYNIDKHGWEEIFSLLEWSQVDEFWKSNILSMKKFREKWNILTAHRARGGEREGRQNKEPKGLDSLRKWAGRVPKP